MSVSTGRNGFDGTAVISDASCAAGTILAVDTTDTTVTKLVLAAATAATTVPVGVALEATSTADATTAVRFAGPVALVKVNGSSTAISEGDAIVATTAGVGVKIGTAGATANYPIGYALQPSSGNGDLIYVLLNVHERGKHTA